MKNSSAEKIKNKRPLIVENKDDTEKEAGRTKLRKSPYHAQNMFHFMHYNALQGGLLTLDKRRPKIESLCHKYEWVQQVLTEDNQVYSSFLFAYVESVWLYKDAAEVERFSRHLKEWHSRNQRLIGSPSLTCSVNMFLELLKEVVNPKQGPRNYYKFFEIMILLDIKSIIVFLKEITSLWLLINNIPGKPEISSEVEELQRHSNIQAYKELFALSATFGVPIHVEVLSEHPSQDFFTKQVWDQASSSSSTPASPTKTCSTPLNFLYLVESSRNKHYYHILYPPAFVKLLVNFNLYPIDDIGVRRLESVVSVLCDNLDFISLLSLSMVAKATRPYFLEAVNGYGNYPVLILGNITSKIFCYNIETQKDQTFPLWDSVEELYVQGGRIISARNGKIIVKFLTNLYSLYEPAKKKLIHTREIDDEVIATHMFRMDECEGGGFLALSYHMEDHDKIACYSYRNEYKYPEDVTWGWERAWTSWDDVRAICHYNDHLIVVWRNGNVGFELGSLFLEGEPYIDEFPTQGINWIKDLNQRFILFTVRGNLYIFCFVHNERKTDFILYKFEICDSQWMEIEEIRDHSLFISFCSESGNLIKHRSLRKNSIYLSGFPGYKYILLPFPREPTQFSFIEADEGKYGAFWVYKDLAEVESKKTKFRKSPYCAPGGLITATMELLTSDERRQKIESLCHKYEWVRQVLTEDNQVYSSFLFAYLESVWLYKDTAEVERFTRRLQLWLLRAQKCEISSPSLTYSVTMFLEVLQEVVDPKQRPKNHYKFYEKMSLLDIKSILVFLQKLVSTWILHGIPDEPEISSEEEELQKHSNIQAYRELIALSVTVGVPIHVEVLSEHPSQDFFTQEGWDKALGSSSKHYLQTETCSTPINFLYCVDFDDNKHYYHILYTPTVAKLLVDYI